VQGRKVKDLEKKSQDRSDVCRVRGRGVVHRINRYDKISCTICINATTLCNRVWAVQHTTAQYSTVQ
jgi:hypothetical protein